MTDQAVFSASYADFKLVKTRSSFQIIIEAPIEQADDFVRKFGIPQPGTEVPVALARLKAAPAKPAELGGWASLSPSQQAWRLCQSPRFQEWELGHIAFRGTSDPADLTRESLCRNFNISSRGELNDHEHDWKQYIARFQNNTGWKPKEERA